MLPLNRQNLLRQEYRDNHLGWRPATELYAELVRKQISSESRLLDLGCGRGGLIEQLDHPLEKIVGIDPDMKSLMSHRLPFPRVSAISDCLPFADNSFDLIFASWLLEHLARPTLTFREIARTLRPGGSFVFITPNTLHPLSIINRALGRFSRFQRKLVRIVYGRTSTDTFPTYYKANSHDSLRRLGQEHGLDLTRLHTVRDPTYLAFTPALFSVMGQLEDYLSESRSLHLVGLFRRKRAYASAS